MKNEVHGSSMWCAYCGLRFLPFGDILSNVLGQCIPLISQHNESDSNTETNSYRWDNFLKSAGQKVVNWSSPVDFNDWDQNCQIECQSQGVCRSGNAAVMNGTVGALPPAAIVGALIEDFFARVKPPDALLS